MAGCSAGALVSSAISRQISNPRRDPAQSRWRWSPGDVVESTTRGIWEEFRAALCIPGGSRCTPPPPPPPGRAADANGGGVEEGEDVLSALPDDMLLLILLRLPSAAAAARTSVLSRRWRRLWARLPELRFPHPADPLALGRSRAALAAHAGGALTLLRVVAYDADPGDAAAVLRLAAPRLTGVFAKLTALWLTHVRFPGGCDLGYALSSARCPLLQKLELGHAQGVSNLAICSESLIIMILDQLRGLQKLTIVAPMLRKLTIFNCFYMRQPVANISAPVLKRLWWYDVYDPRSVQLGELAQLRELVITYFAGPQGYFQYMRNRGIVLLLQHFQKIAVLTMFIYPTLKRFRLRRGRTSVAAAWSVQVGEQQDQPTQGHGGLRHARARRALGGEQRGNKSRRRPHCAWASKLAAACPQASAHSCYRFIRGKHEFMQSDLDFNHSQW
ncbi:unnamed protein product [Urochloa decumbens]|uniref:F-box domain-containing protein n=1 Tax=Urochloa decumbens TaxID=240449 RepID=A0ABC8ZZE9_9POAL